MYHLMLLQVDEQSTIDQYLSSGDILRKIARKEDDRPRNVVRRCLILGSGEDRRNTARLTSQPAKDGPLDHPISLGDI